MDQPSHYEQLLAALDTARYMAGHLPPDDQPATLEAVAHSTFPAVGLADVVGVVLRGIRSVDALDRMRTTFGGEITHTRRSSTSACTSYTEHELVGSVRGVPYLAVVCTDHERLPLPRRGDRRSEAPDVVMVPVPPQNTDEDLDARCRVCGCTEDRACPGGCAWVPDPQMEDLCSACAPQTLAPAGGEAL